MDFERARAYHRNLLDSISKRIDREDFDSYKPRTIDTLLRNITEARKIGKGQPATLTEIRGLCPSNEQPYHIKIWLERGDYDLNKIGESILMANGLHDNHAVAIVGDKMSWNYMHDSLLKAGFEEWARSDPGEKRVVAAIKPGKAYIDIIEIEGKDYDVVIRTHGKPEAVAENTELLSRIVKEGNLYAHFGIEAPQRFSFFHIPTGEEVERFGRADA